MISKLISGFAAVCVATVITQMIVMGYFLTQGTINGDTLTNQRREGWWNTLSINLVTGDAVACIDFFAFCQQLILGPGLANSFEDCRCLCLLLSYPGIVLILFHCMDNDRHEAVVLTTQFRALTADRIAFHALLLPSTTTEPLRAS